MPIKTYPWRIPLLGNGVGSEQSQQLRLSMDEGKSIELNIHNERTCRNMGNNRVTTISHGLRHVTYHHIGDFGMPSVQGLYFRPYMNCKMQGYKWRNRQRMTDHHHRHDLVSQRDKSLQGTSDEKLMKGLPQAQCQWLGHIGPLTNSSH